MKTLKLFLFILIMATAFAQSGCDKSEMDAIESIEGDWNVIEITSIYGEFTSTGGNSTERIEETGQLGTFSFTDDSVDFSFMRNDTLFQGTSTWELEYERIRSGFFREPLFTLTIEDQFLFNVGFEDGVQNAERDAMEMRFDSITEEGEEDNLVLIMLLEKI